MNLNKIVKKLAEKIKANESQDKINNFEDILSENIEELSKNEEFFNLPLKNIFSVISKVDFSEIDENDKIIEIIQNIIKNIILNHSDEKETILILQNIDTKTISFSSYEEIFSLLELITNCPILVNYCNLYKDDKQLASRDYDFELLQKDEEVKDLKKELVKLRNKFPPIIDKPKDFEPNIFRACKDGKLTSVQWLIEKENENVYQILMKKNGIDSFNIGEGDSPIHVAARNGHLQIVQYLIERQNVEKNTKGNLERTPLHYACLNDYLPIVQYLISKGANIALKDRNGDAPFILAYKNKCEDIIEYIQLFFHFPEDFEPNILKACQDGKLKSVQCLYTKLHVDINVKGSGDMTPILYACEKGHLQVVDYLISKGANVTAKNEDGDYVIHFASMSGLLPIVKYLLIKKNVDKDIEGFWKKTLLHYACEKGQFQIVKYLITKEANIEAKDQSEETPLILACKEGHLQIVEYLLSKNAKIEAKNYNEQNSLHFACKAGHLQIVEYLISKGANIHAKSKGLYDGMEPIHYASSYGHLSIVECLILNGADVEAKDKDGRTPLHHASTNNNIDIVKYLISKGANKYAKDKHDKTPFDRANDTEIKNILK